jgi:hypothetical protein
VPGRRDPKPILAQRPHLDVAPGCLDPQEGRRSAALPRFGVGIADGAVTPYLRPVVGETLAGRCRRTWTSCARSTRTGGRAR